MWRIATDTGGTFTDAYAMAPDGRATRCKVLSSGCLRVRLTAVSGMTWQVQGLPLMADGFYQGFKIGAALAGGFEWEVVDWQRGSETLVVQGADAEAPPPGSLLDLRTGEEAPVLAARLLTGTPPGAAFPPLELRLATTRATNALLERKGTATAFFTTSGFGDLLKIGDQRRAELFALQHEPRPVFFTQAVEVIGRMAADGTELEPLDEAALRVAAERLVAQGLCHAAVAFLHSHLNPAHEIRAGAVLKEAGFVHVSLSSAIAPFSKILPRAQSAVANAYLTGPVEAFLAGVEGPLSIVGGHDARLRILTSAGGLETTRAILPKDLLLSGPAGGALGAANAARQAGWSKVLTLDMGGTSTDVARIEGRPGHRFTQNIAGMQLMAPCVAIETVAAGGGSICRWTHQGLAVGPESAGSSPGPACYGRGGPLTITDVNLLLGRFDPARAPIPLDMDAARSRLKELHAQAGGIMTQDELLRACLRLAVEHMADAIRRISVAEGYDPAGYALLAFGGAGPQHACAVAERLGMRTVLVPGNAGILSAVGLHQARPERFAEKQILRPLASCLEKLPHEVQELADQARRHLADLERDASPATEINAMAELRLRGQDLPLLVPFESAAELPGAYHATYQRLFGYPPPSNREIEIVSLRVKVRVLEDEVAPLTDTPVSNGVGPALLQDEFSTLVVEPGWESFRLTGFGHIVKRLPDAMVADAKLESAVFTRELVRHRLHSIVSEMGALLCRTAISTNIRERLDFSCALLDAHGRLVSSAPHIPVHLGALGVCVREVARLLPLKPGDTIVTNHPAHGGSHLPDVTLVTPVFSDSRALLGYVANRAHHAELGGLTPGSMPATAHCLAEEGVVIAPTYLVRQGVSCFDELAIHLTSGRFPTRNVADNLADLHAQLAANLQGAAAFQALAAEVRPSLEAVLSQILEHSAAVMRDQIQRAPEGCARQTLDDGSVIQVALRKDNDRLVVDFTGTAATHPGNLNATTAIVRSALLYVLRLWLQEDLPLNEGLLEPVEAILPPGTLLNPMFTGDPAQDPAVVGGNVEVSQRVVDTLLLALELQACSQGTMNNFLFGGAGFGYYETIAGGTGGGPAGPGADAIHSHMTNTAITDPEILELRYPVRLRQFSIRQGSGGAGQWRGGNGVVREFEFLAPLTLSLLTQHRTNGPYGLHGGAEGAPGRQTLFRSGQAAVELPPSISLPVESGDRLRLETPGGGGWGKVDVTER